SIHLGNAPEPDRLFFRARRMLMRPHNSAVDHQVGVLGILNQHREDFRPYLRRGPTAEASMGVLPISVPLGQIPPWGAGAQYPQYRIDELPIVFGGDAYRIGSARQQVFDLLPLTIRQFVSLHWRQFLAPWEKWRAA